MSLGKAISWVSRCCPVTVYTRTPTLDSHNFHVQAPFWVFLDTMESPLSLELSIYSLIKSDLILGPKCTKNSRTLLVRVSYYSYEASNFRRP